MTKKWPLVEVGLLVLRRCIPAHKYICLYFLSMLSQKYFWENGQFTIAKRETDGFSVTIWFLVTKISKLWKIRAEQAICTKRCPQAIIESILGLWQKRLDTFCENRKKACKDLGQIGAAKNHYHHHVFTLDRGTSPWIDPTGVCRAWLVLTIRVDLSGEIVSPSCFWTTMFSGPSLE